MHQTKVGDLPPQSSSLTFFFLFLDILHLLLRGRCLWSVRREDLGTGENVGVERVVALIKVEEFTLIFCIKKMSQDRLTFE